MAGIAEAHAMIRFDRFPDFQPERWLQRGAFHQPLFVAAPILSNSSPMR